MFKKRKTIAFRNEAALILTDIFRCSKNTFMNVFLMAFMMKISLKNDPTGYLTLDAISWAAVAILTTMFLRFFIKHPLFAWRASVIASVLEILMVIFFSSWPGFIYAVAIFSAIQSTFYWRPKMYFETNEIDDENRVRYQANSRIAVEFVRIVIPFSLGVLIDSSSYQQAAVAILVLAILQLITSFFFRPQNSKQEPSGQKHSFHNAIKLISSRRSLKNVILLQIILGIISSSAYTVTATYALNRAVESDALRGLAATIGAIIAIIGLSFIRRLTKNLQAQHAVVVAIIPGIILVPLVAIFFPNDPIYAVLFYIFMQIVIYALIESAFGRSRIQNILSRHLAQPEDRLAIEALGHIVLSFVRAATLGFTLLGFIFAGYQGMLIVTTLSSLVIFPFAALAIPSSHKAIRRTP